MAVVSARAALRYPRLRVDGLLSEAAGSHPHQASIADGATELTFTALDAVATKCANALRRQLPEPGSVVGLASGLNRWFAVVYFGAVRSGNIVAPINPFLRDEALAHVLRSSRARIVFVTPDMAERIAGIRTALEHLLHVVMLAEDDGGTGWPTIKDLIDGVPGASVATDGGAGGAVDLDDVACLLFTSGTTGLPKTVQLTHRNVTVNAVQVADAHGLDETAVLLNYLPTFHPMHLTAGIYSRATHVLCASQDVGESIEVARAAGVTHYYSLPVRLARLAVDPRLAQFEVPTLRLIASGGSSLAPASATALSNHFGIPAIQGYGLAETSPLTHSDVPARWKPGSVGPPVADTECRIVEVTSRQVLASGEAGEVQVRGPQVMKGYLGDVGQTAIDAQGWFATGDVGYEDEDGYLFLVDRIKDVFKCDNWLVSPTEIERVVTQHPAIAECVVVGLPDEFRGAIPFAFVVLADPEARPSIAGEALEEINPRLTYYQQITRFEVVQQIPRGPTGKVSRTKMAAAARARAGAQSP